MTTAQHALDLISDGQVVGLGTGHAATAFIQALGEKVQAGLNVRGVPTSKASATLAASLGIPLVSLDEVEALDVAVDGADEVDPELNLIKGWGGALVREKIVAASARRFVILVGTEKLVPKLGTRDDLPVEVVPFALGFCQRRIVALGGRPELRLRDGRPFVTDNGNHILDCHFGPIADPHGLDRALNDTPGVLGTGLFLGMAHVVFVQDGDTVRVMERPSV